MMRKKNCFPKKILKPPPKQQFTCFTVISGISSGAVTGITVNTILARSPVTAPMIHAVVNVCKKKNNTNKGTR